MEGSNVEGAESPAFIVMAGRVPAIHAFPHDEKNVDARVKPAHDDVFG